MPCQTQTSQQPQQPTTVLPQNLPKTQADWQRFLQRMNELLGSINNAQYATGVNAVPTEYAVYDGTALPALRITGATSAFDTAHAQFGVGSLKLTATASTVTVELAASGYPITLHPNWKWIASLFLLTSAANITGKLSVVTPAQQYDVDISGSPGASWSRLYGDYDLTADASTSCTLLLTLTGVTIGQVFNVEGWMLEPSQGAVLPSPFIMTSGPRTWNQVVGSDAVNTNITTAQTTANTANTTANTSNTNANTAVGQVAQLPVINGGFDIAPTGYGWVADPGSGWTIDTAGNTPGVGPNSAMHAGGAGAGAYRNAGLAACGPNQVYKAQGLIKAAGANGACWVYISWCRADGSEISSTAGNQITGTTTGGSYATGAAPAGTVYARTCLGVSGHTAGTYYVDNVLCSQYPSSLGEVPDGGGYSKVNSVQVTQGVVTLLGTGRNAILNPNFTQNFSGSVANAYTYTGAVIDHWTISGVAANSAGYWAGANINIRVLAGFSIAGSSTTIGPTISSDPFAVKAADSFALKIDRSGYASNGAPAGVSPYHRVYLSFLDSSGSVVSNSINDAVYGGAIAPITVTGTVPAGAVSCIARLNIYFVNTGAAATWPAGFIDATLNSIEYVQAANLDSEVIDGQTYARIYGSDLSSGRHKLTVAGSGLRVGDQRNLPQRTITNYPSKVSPGVSYSASAGSPATATITAAAFTALLGSVSVSYNAASASVTGTNGTNVNYYLYFNDPTYSGGTHTLVATTNQNDLYSGDGYVYVGYVTVAFPSSGSGSGGGTGCPLRTAWVIRRGRHGRPQFVRAGKVRVGDWLLRTDGEWAEVTFSQPELQPCVRLVADGFGTLGCSISAPMQLRDGSALSIDCLDREVVARAAGVCGHVAVTVLRNLGDQWVQHITLGNAPDDFFWTGDAKDALFGHHNLKPP